ncbi:hypothetical protein BHM03_00053164 [Ensete ventricosum]|nr:hypothetical protein BHM03_00053164 [Ensete ventricosum]
MRPSHARPPSDQSRPTELPGCLARHSQAARTLRESKGRFTSTKPPRHTSACDSVSFRTADPVGPPLLPPDPPKQTTTNSRIKYAKSSAYIYHIRAPASPTHEIRRGPHPHVRETSARIFTREDDSLPPPSIRKRQRRTRVPVLVCGSRGGRRQHALFLVHATSLMERKRLGRQRWGRRPVVRVGIDHGGRVGVALGDDGGRRLEAGDDHRRTKRQVAVVPGHCRLGHRGCLGSGDRVEEEQGLRRRDGRMVWLEGKAGSAAATVEEVEIERGRERNSDRGHRPRRLLRTGRLYGAALAAGASGTPSARGDAAVAGAGVDAGVRPWEVGLGLGSAELAGGGVVGPRGLLRRVESPEPDAALLAGVTNLRCVTPPRPLPHSSEMLLLPFSTTHVVGRLRSRRHDKGSQTLGLSYNPPLLVPLFRRRGENDRDTPFAAASPLRRHSGVNWGGRDDSGGTPHSLLVKSAWIWSAGSNRNHVVAQRPGLNRVNLTDSGPGGKEGHWVFDTFRRVVVGGAPSHGRMNPAWEGTQLLRRGFGLRGEVVPARLETDDGGR